VRGKSAHDRCVLRVHCRGHKPLWERKWVRTPLQEVRQQFLHRKCAEDQPWVDSITQEHMLQTRRVVAKQNHLLHVATSVIRFLSYHSILCNVFDVFFFPHVVRLGASFLIIFPPLISSLYTPSAVQEQSLSPMKALPHQSFLPTSCAFDCCINCFLFCCTVFFNFKTLSSMY